MERGESPEKSLYAETKLKGACMANYALFIEHRDGNSVIVNPDQVRFVRELNDRATEPATEIAFADGHSLIVKSAVRDVWSALIDAGRS